VVRVAIGISTMVLAVVVLLTNGADAGDSTVAAGAPAVSAPSPTLSRYEATDDPTVLRAQGVADGAAGLSGLAILDFGRPAEVNGVAATLDFGSALVPVSSLVPAVEAYADGYRSAAPRGATMTVALGTNDSCGTGQPCGSGICGCNSEPPNFLVWGQSLGQAVADIGTYLSSTSDSYAATASAAGADDAEPAYDPAFTNTYDVLAGYDESTTLPMVDYGSIDGGPVTDGFWTPEQMYLVANGLRPDAALPEIYHPGMADQWAALSHWAVTATGAAMPFAGVLTESPAGFTPTEGAAALHAALTSDFPDTAQASWSWASNIEPQG
jgi:hypothetical protein